MTDRRSVILDEATRWLVPVTLLVAVYITFRGHNAPGGGFSGGLIAGAAFVLRHLAGLRLQTAGGWSLRPTALVGGGLAVASTTAIMPLLFGATLLESAIWTIDVPLIGTVKVVSSTFFDIGVFLVVVGAVLMVLVALGSDVAPERIRPGNGVPCDAEVAQ